MEDLFILLIVILLIVLCIITFIGHGMWVLAALVLRALFGDSEEAPADSSLRTRCNECGAGMRLNDDFCPSCGKWQRASADPHRPGGLAELAIAARQLDWLLNQGKLDVETHKRVMRVVDGERNRTAAPTEQRAAEPVSSVQPKVERSMVERPAPVERAIPGKPKEKPIEIAEPVAEAAMAVSASETERERRSLTGMLATFMEDRSIRWGELIGGLLILGCSIALVISLWSQISSRPFLKFSVFAGVTAGLFGLGFYSAHRWRLPTTSRGVLIISTLLVPLNFLAISAFAQANSSSPMLAVGGGMLALALLLYLVYQASRVIAARSSWAMVAAVLGPSFGTLLAAQTDGAGRWSLLGAAPILCYWASVGDTLRKWRAAGEEDDDQTWLMLGIATFAALLPLGLLLVKPLSIEFTIRQFAPLIALFAAPAIACSVALLHRESIVNSGERRTAAMSVGIIGSMLALAGLAVAWPNPASLVAAAIINCAICAAVARFATKPEFKFAHIGAIAHLSVAWLIVCNLFGGGIASGLNDAQALAGAFTSVRSGQALLVLFLLFGIGAESFRKAAKNIEAQIYAIAAIVVGAISLSLITAHGFGRLGDPHLAGLFYAIYAALAFVIAWRTQESLAAWFGAALSLLAIEQTLAFGFGRELAAWHPTRLSLMLFTTLAVATLPALRRVSAQARSLYEAPLACSALICSFVLAPALLFGGWMTNAGIAARVFWLALVWLMLAFVMRWTKLFAAFQAATALGLALGIASLMGRRWPEAGMWLDPLTLQAMAIALALLGLGWVAARLLLRRRLAVQNETDDKMFALASLNRFLNPAHPRVDAVVNWALLALLAALSLISVHVGIIEELATGRAISSGWQDAATVSLGLGSRLLLLALFLVFATGLWERFERRAVVAMQILLACACLLIAGRAPSIAGAATMPGGFLAAGFALLALLIVKRERVEQVCQAFQWPGMRQRAAGLAAVSRNLALVLFALPVVGLTLGVFGNIVLDSYILGARAGSGTAFLVPLLIVSGSVLALGLGQRSIALTCASGMLLDLAVALGCLSLAILRGEEVTRAVVIRMTHWMIIATALFTIVWALVARRARWREAEPALAMQISVALCAALVFLGLADLRLALDPDVNSAIANAAGGLWGWLAAGIAATGFAMQSGLKGKDLRTHHLCAALTIFGSLVACSLSRLDNDWIAFRALLLTTLATAWLMLGLRWIAGSRFRDRTNDLIVRILNIGHIGRIGRIGAESETEVAAAALGGVAILLALLGFDSMWWTACASAALCLLFAGLSCATRRRSYVYVAGLLPTLTATALYGDGWPDYAEGFFVINLITLSLSAIAALVLDLKVIRSQASSSIPPFHQPFHRVAARAVFGAMVVEFVIGVVSQVGDSEIVYREPRFHWLMLGAVAASLIACLWDDESDFAPRWLYGVGLLLIGEVFLAVKPGGRGLIAGSVVSLSLYALLTGALFRKADWLAPLADRLRMPAARGSAANRAFLVSANSVLACAVAPLTIVAVLALESGPQRLLAATVAFAIPLSLVLLATEANRLIAGAAPLALLNAVLWSWAWLPAPAAGRLHMLNRLMIVVLIAEAVVVGYRLLAMKSLAKDGIGARIKAAVRDDLPVVAAIGLAALGVVLAVETSNYLAFGMSLMPSPMIAVLFLTLLGLIAVCIAFALLPDEDPFDLDERGRRGYVYGAEALVALTMMHVRVTMPWMFSGAFQTWWPLIVMAIAFAGVGLGEMFRRQGRMVLAEPLERTGIALPLLPLLGFWALDSNVPLSGLLLLVGLFYGVLSVMRRSFAFGLMAALAGNGGFWRILDGVEGAGFFEHPQLWLIPVALSVLAAARINRDHLKPEQMTAIRYATLVTIYVSSTADIFINGVADAPWLPILLAVLSVAGVIAGLMMRVRAFLFLGASFLLLSVVTMIWTASVNFDWDWLWYVMGIAFGVLIIYVFAMFERKRGEMMALVERLKHWQA